MSLCSSNYWFKVKKPQPTVSSRQQRSAGVATSTSPQRASPRVPGHLSLGTQLLGSHASCSRVSGRANTRCLVCREPRPCHDLGSNAAPLCLSDTPEASFDARQARTARTPQARLTGTSASRTPGWIRVHTRSTSRWCGTPPSYPIQGPRCRSATRSACVTGACTPTPKPDEVAHALCHFCSDVGSAG